MTVENTLCGDYPAPCNCDNPDTHDGAVTVLDPEMVQANLRRLDAVINNYKAFSRHLDVVATEDSIPTTNALADYQRAMNLAMVAYPLRTILTNNDGGMALFLIKNIIRQAISLEGVKLALEVEQSFADA